MRLEPAKPISESDLTSNSIPIYSLGQLRRRDPPSYLIHRVIPENGLVYLVAEPSNKKTFLAIHMACCIQTGTSFFGKPVKQGNVVYVAAEGQSGIQKRAAAWEMAQGITVPEDQFSVIPAAIDLTNPVKHAELINSLEQLREKLGSLDFIVIDTLSRCLLGDENSAKEMTAFVASCTALIRRFSCAVLILHHPAKSGNGGARGHSSLEGAADLGLQIRNGKNEKFLLKLDAKPPKDDEPAEDIHLQADVMDLSSTLGIDAEGKPITSLALKSICARAPEPKANHRPISAKAILSDTIKRMLGKGPAARQTILGKIKANDSSANSRAIDRALDSLCEDGVIYKPERGVYALTQLGLDIEN